MTTSSMSSALGKALRRKFPGPGGARAALRHLGLDEQMLESVAAPAPPPSPRHGGEDDNGEGDRLRKMRIAIEQLMAEFGLGGLSDEKMAAMARLLDEHAPEGHDEEPDTDEAFKAHLKSKGLSDEDVTRALSIVHGAVKAKDYASGEPRNNFAISGERGRGSELATDAALRRKYPGVARLGPSLPPCRPAEPSPREARQAMDSTRSSLRGRASFEQRFPEARRIGQG